MTMNPSKKFLVNLSQFLNAVHISTLNCDEMAENRERQSAYKIFSIHINFSSLSSNPLGSRRPVQAGIKDSYPLKSGYFTAINLV